MGVKCLRCPSNDAFLFMIAVQTHSHPTSITNRSRYYNGNRYTHYAVIREYI